MVREEGFEPSKSFDMIEERYSWIDLSSFLALVINVWYRSDLIVITL